MVIAHDVDLQHAIREQAPTWRTNHAMTAIVDDYAKYHVAFVIAGGVAVVVLAALSMRLWHRLPTAPKQQQQRRRPSERSVRFIAAASCSIVAALLGVIVLANASNARDPLPGLLAASAHPTPNTVAVDRDVADWLRSGRADMPATVHAKVAHRLAWQRPKAVICAVLLMLAALAVRRVWQVLMRYLRSPRRRTLATGSLLVAEGVASSLALLLLVMLLGNLQASIAPLSLTLLGGS